MPKLASILFLMVFCLPVSSLYLSFKVKQQYVRQEMEAKMDKGVPADQLVLLKIPRALEENPGTEFKRMHAREFRYRGNMYDVVRQEAHGDTTWYWCVWDEEETKLVAKLNKLVAKASGGANPPQESHELFKHLLETPFVATPCISIHVITLPAARMHRHLHGHTLRRTLVPLTPPPEAFVILLL